MFSTAWLCIFAALVDTIYCAPSFLLCVIAASISVTASPLLPLPMNSRTYLHGCNFKTLIQTGRSDRLTHLVSEQSSERVRGLWSALALWQEKDRRFVRLSKLYTGPQQDLLHLGTEFQIKRHGVDRRFKGSGLRVPANLLRDRVADVLSPADLAKRHRAYHYRVMIGPSYRADMWAALESRPELSTAELARKTYGSFATAWRVKREFAVLASQTVRSAAVQKPRSA